MDPNTEYETLPNELDSKLTLNPTEDSETETLQNELNSKLTLNPTQVSETAHSDLASPQNSHPNKSKGKEVISDEGSSSKTVQMSAVCYLHSIEEKYKDEKLIMLKCEGGEEIAVPLALAVQSGYVRNMLEVGLDDDVVLVPLVSAHVLMMLVQYWDCHVGEQDKLKEIDDWEEGFFQMIGPDNMYDLLIGANYIDARGCLERGAEYVADLIRRMKVDEIREYFGLKNDFSPQEEEQLEKDYPWAHADDDVTVN